MSEALEALEKLSDMAHATADEYAEMGGGLENERLEKIIRAALEQPSTAGRPSEEIKQRARDIEDAIAAGDMSAGQVYTQMWQLVDKASCESSTAEAQARALGEFEQELLELGAKCRQEDPGWSDALAMVAGMARAKAKRIREEAK